MRRIRWIAATAALLALGAWLSSLAEVRPVSAARAEVRFPAWPRTEEYRRMQERKTLVLPASASGEGEPAGPGKRDPFLAALPARAEDPVVVFEANALRHSRLGEAFVACALARDPRMFEEIRRETGIDVLKDVDRVAFVGEAVVVSGFFERLDTRELSKATGSPERYGEAGVVYGADEPPSGARMVAGTWRDQILVLSSQPETVRLALDQLEGRAPPAPVDLPDDIAYGEAYGVVSGDALRRILRGTRDLLADRLAAAASRVEFHVDAMQDVAAVVRFRGTDESALSDLARAMGGALAAARLQAAAKDDAAVADLLDQAAVVPGDDGFAVRVALPADRVESWFAGCRP